MKIRIEDDMPLVYLEAKPEEIRLLAEALNIAATRHATGKYDRLLTVFVDAAKDLYSSDNALRVKDLQE